MSSKGKAKNNARVAVRREVDETLAKLDMKPRTLTAVEIGQLLGVRGPAIAHALDYLAGEMNVIDPHTYVHRNECHRLRQHHDVRRHAANVSALRNPLFRKACEIAETEPTTRQAAKWQRHTGLAWSRVNDARNALATAA